MVDLPPFWTVPLGMVAGAICVSLFARWIRLLLVAIGKKPGAAPSLQRGSRIGAIVVTILHPVPWLVVVGLPVGVFQIIAHSPGEPWLWFFGSTLTSVICIYAISFYIWHRRRRVAANRGPSNRDQPAHL